MGSRTLNKIFLSASIPLASREPEYFETADMTAIRDSVRALAAVVIPNAHLVWGGHPSITPLIRYVLGKMRKDIKSHVTLYQSLFYEEIFPPDNFDFENIVLTEKLADVAKSLRHMRERMFAEHDFKAAVFIGGMKGIKDEYYLFREFHPRVPVFPVASTGAAAKQLYYSEPGSFNSRLADDYAYLSMFRDLLAEFIE